LYVNREGFVGTSLKKKTRYRLFGYRWRNCFFQVTETWWWPR
jgi:hypothetical protein